MTFPELAAVWIRTSIDVRLAGTCREPVGNLSRVAGSRQPAGAARKTLHFCQTRRRLRVFIRGRGAFSDESPEDPIPNVQTGQGDGIVARALVGALHHVLGQVSTTGPKWIISRPGDVPLM